MVQAGILLDTPRSNLGDATYLDNQPDFDISQEGSFHSPAKSGHILQQMGLGRRDNLRTPRGRALRERQNLPSAFGTGEFTPLLKTATRNSAINFGKENKAHRTPKYLKPGGLDNVAEELSPVPLVESSAYGDDTRNGSFAVGTPLPQMISSSAASTPVNLLPRRTDGDRPLQDSNQLSLREQEHLVDKIEKENFGLKLKIHFLEEALRKAGPGYNEATLKENTDLKVDKVTLMKDLKQCRKEVMVAQRELESCRQQYIEMKERQKHRRVIEGQQEEMDLLRRTLEAKDTEIDNLKHKLNESRSQDVEMDRLKDEVGDLEADLREKERTIEQQEDEVDGLKSTIEEQHGTIADIEEAMKAAQRRAVEMEEKAQASVHLENAKDKIEDLQEELEKLKAEVEEMEEERQQALADKERAETDLEELQDEMANKSFHTKGLSRQIEDKANRAQEELEDLRDQYNTLQQQYEDKALEVKRLSERIRSLEQNSDGQHQKLKDSLEMVTHERDVANRERTTAVAKLQSAQDQLQRKTEERDLLQNRHDALTSESKSLSRDLTKARSEVDDLQDKLDHEKTLALNNEREVRDTYKAEIDRLSDDVEDLRAEVREKDRIYDEDNDKWETERRTIESDRDKAEEEAAGLRRTIQKLQEVEGDLSSKENKLMAALNSEEQRHQSEEAILVRQIQELHADVEVRRQACDDIRNELVKVREELRISQREQKNTAEQVQGLEDEIQILQDALDDEAEHAKEDIAAARHESEGLRKQLHGLKQDLARAEASLSDARAEVEKFKSDLHAGLGSKDQLSSRLKDVESKLFTVRQEKQDLRDQLTKVTQEKNSLQVSTKELEAEREELENQVQDMKRQEDTFRVDQEKIDLRTSKIKLDNEIRRSRDEKNALSEQLQATREELEQEIERASAEEARLNGEIRDLMRKSTSSSTNRELSVAKHTIRDLETRIQELESQGLPDLDNDNDELSFVRRDLHTARQREAELHRRETSQKETIRGLKRQVSELESRIQELESRGAFGLDDDNDAAQELSIMRRDLETARQKETEFTRHEVAQKEIVRGLKRQIADIERRVHNDELSRFQVPSSPSSHGGSARKAEIVEVRQQLATAHQTLRELRTQLKDVERDASRKLKAASLDLESKSQAWEDEKFTLERELAAATSSKEDLVLKNAAAEKSIGRLKSKIDRLERELKAERDNIGEERTIAHERRDLHEMLRETQVQAEELEIAIKERDRLITKLNTSSDELRSQLKRIREERSKQKERAISALSELSKLEQKYMKAQESWNAEKQQLTRGVRFPNMSVSDLQGDRSQLDAVIRVGEEKEKIHEKEMRGLGMQLQWFYARYKREQAMRADAAYAKKYMMLQIELYNACNAADLHIMAQMGITPDRSTLHAANKKPTSIRTVAFMIIGINRMKKGAEEWAKSRKIHERLVAKVDDMKRKELVLGQQVRGVERGGNGRRGSGLSLVAGAGAR